jgi:hypothetical protein
VGPHASPTVSVTDKVGHSTAKTCSYTVIQGTPVITWAAPAPILYGTKLGAAQLNATANVPGTFVYSPPAGTVLPYGTNQLTVTFKPTSSADYVQVTKSVPITVKGSQACLTTNFVGAITVKSGSAYCILAGGKVTGTITVQSGGSLWVDGGTITGILSSSGATAFALYNSTLNGAVSITGTTGPVMIGAATGCGANKVLAAMTVSKNSGSVSIVGNTLNGVIGVSSNTGGVTFSNNKALLAVSFASNAGGVTVNANTIGGAVSVISSTGGVSFTNNTITGALSIQNNKGGFVYTGNHVTGPVTIKNNT